MLPFFYPETWKQPTVAPLSPRWGVWCAWGSGSWILMLGAKPEEGARGGEMPPSNVPHWLSREGRRWGGFETYSLVWEQMRWRRVEIWKPKYVPSRCSMVSLSMSVLLPVALDWLDSRLRRIDVYFRTQHKRLPCLIKGICRARSTRSICYPAAGFYTPAPVL